MENQHLQFVDIELAFIVIMMAILLVGIVLGHVMVQDYNKQLEHRRKTDHSINDFLKQESFYINLFFGFTLIITNVLLICILSR